MPCPDAIVNDIQMLNMTCPIPSPLPRPLFPSASLPGEGPDRDQVDGGEEASHQDRETTAFGGGLPQEVGQGPQRQWCAHRHPDRDGRQESEK